MLVIKLPAKRNRERAESCALRAKLRIPSADPAKIYRSRSLYFRRWPKRRRTPVTIYSRIPDNLASCHETGRRRPHETAKRAGFAAILKDLGAGN
jgi:hypothetical protein